MTMGSLDTGDTVPDEAGQNHEEPHGAGMAGRLNWLRAGVLGANDGIVSTAGIVIGVAGATANRSVILTAGIAGLAAGALSMAVGEYVSVSTQRDTERALLAKERRELHEMPDEELAELTEIYVGKGLSPDVAAHGGPAADRPRRAGRPRGGRARHQPRRADQPVARRLRVPGRLHRGRPAAAAGDRPAAPRARGSR